MLGDGSGPLKEKPVDLLVKPGWLVQALWEEELESPQLEQVQ